MNLTCPRCGGRISLDYFNDDTAEIACRSDRACGARWDDQGQEIDLGRWTQTEVDAIRAAAKRDAEAAKTLCD